MSNHTSTVSEQFRAKAGLPPLEEEQTEAVVSEDDGQDELEFDGPEDPETLEDEQL